MKNVLETYNLFSVQSATGAVIVPRYGIRLVRESQAVYRQGLTGASVVLDLCKAIGLQERACEELHVFYVDTKLKVTGMELITKGTLNASLVHAREVFKGAILANAYGIIMVHNHPSGDPEPSNQDKEVTRSIVQAANILDIRFLDHIIIGVGEYYSFKQTGNLPE
jgi:DNA repair protein RadC